MNSRKTIAIYTFSMGRWHYLEKSVRSVLRARQEYLGPTRHIVCLQGVAPPPFLTELGEQVEMIHWSTNCGIAEGINRVAAMLSEDLVIKLDDDCEIISARFLTHVAEVARLCPNLVFSPFPVGLIRNLGGVPSKERSIVYSDRLDTYYTLRAVPHVGGFCRVSPRITTNWVLQPDLGIAGASGNEDVQFSTLCGENRIPMAYLENAIIVEHQESTLGQHARYGNEYFGDRF